MALPQGTTQVPLDQVLSQIGIGWFHVQLWWVCGLGFSAAAIEVVLMSFVFPELAKKPWSLDEYQLGSLATIIGCGSICGTTFWGAMADRYGRRTVFMITVCFVVVFGIASSFATSYYWLAGLRFWVGFGYGGNIATDFTLYSEFLPTNGRGKMLFFLTGFWPLGQIFACLLAWLLIPRLGWQYFIAACAVPSMITACFRPLIPESPRWLLLHGRTDEAKEVCIHMAELNGKSAAEIGLDGSVEVCLNNETTGLEDGFSKELIASPLVSLTRFFNAQLWRTTLGLLILVSALNYTGYGTLTLMPRFLEAKGVSQPEMYRSMLLNSSAQIPGVFIATILATTIGRLMPLRSSLFLAGIGLFGFALAREQVHITLCTMFASCFLEAGWALYHVYVPEVYPTECRGLATGFLSASGSIVSITGPIASAALMTSTNIASVVMVFASVAMFAGCCAILLLHIETKDRDLLDLTPSRGTEKKIVD